jgi:predicted DCC family thiol-disulfide oxidoreductase YuxK
MGPCQKKPTSTASATGLGFVSWISRRGSIQRNLLTGKISSSHPIILFDGICNLCNGFVRYIIRMDRNDVFRFGLLQSDHVRSMLRRHELEISSFASVILLEGERIAVESDAVLRIARILGGGWNSVYLFKIVPNFIRDYLYRIISRHRYRLFGKRDACMIPPPELRDKFI